MPYVLLALLSICFLMEGCTSNGEYENRLSQGDSVYANTCRMAFAGERGAIQSLLRKTNSYDGEGLLQHGINLFIIRENNRQIFEQELNSFSQDDRMFIDDVVMQGKKFLRGAGKI